MLPKIALQVIASNILYESDLPKNAKLQVLKFIELANIKQLQYYIVHREFIKENEQSNISEADLPLPAATIITRATNAARVVYDKFFSKAAQACSDKKGQDRKECMKRFKVNGLTGKLAAFKKEMGECDQTINPPKCRDMFLKYIKNTEEQLKKVRFEQVGGYTQMDINRMRLGLMYIFAENVNLSKKAKLQLVNFIEGANEYQLKVLAMDGEVTSKEFDIPSIKIIEERFQSDEQLNEKLRKASFRAMKRLIN